MKRVQKAVMRVILSVICFLISSTAAADFESASAAYRNQNYAQAFEEFTGLAEAGDARAQTVLAIMYKYGESIPADPEKAYDWYLRAAVQGYPPAQYNVGIMLAEGIGVAADRAQAASWLQKAADGGYERANDRLAELGGNARLATINDEPVAWSKSWNLRLPNDIRFQEDAEVDLAIKVYRVQLGAMGSLAAAERLWQLLHDASPGFLGNFQPIFREARSSGRTIYRLQVGPFEEESLASRFCEELAYRIENTTGCVVVKTN